MTLDVKNIHSVVHHEDPLCTVLDYARNLNLGQREVQLGEPVSLERSDFEEQQENSGQQDGEDDGLQEYDSSSSDEESNESLPDGETVCDNGDIPSLEREADFLLGGVYRFGRIIHFNSRIAIS